MSIMTHNQELKPSHQHPVDAADHSAPITITKQNGHTTSLKNGDTNKINVASGEVKIPDVKVSNIIGE